LKTVLLGTEADRRDHWYNFLRSDPAYLPAVCCALDLDEHLQRPFLLRELALPNMLCLRMVRNGILQEDGEGLFRVGDPSAIAWAVAKAQYVKVRLKVWAVMRR
jgi:hypothetical protein